VPTIDYDSVAEFYDLYVAADFDVAFFTAEVRLAAGPVLELTSGTGRLSVPLIEAGADLTCVDISQGMLAILSRKLAERGLRADVRCADVCDLDLPARFDLAILPFQSFMEIVGAERQRAALARVFAALRPGGRFICTMHNPAVRRAQVDGVLRIVGQFPSGGGTLVVSGFEQGGRPVVSRLQFFEFYGPDGLLAWKRALPMEFAFVEREEFAQLAAGAGFRVLQLYGNYERAPFDPVNSPVMIWALEKPAESDSANAR
jgi:SAM-dependent methyltransferase